MTEETRNPQQTTQKRKRSPLSSQILAERAATPLPIDSPDRIEWEKLAAKHDAARTDKTKEKLTADERKRLDELKTQYKAWIRSDNDESTEYGATDSATKKRQTTETEKQASAAEAIPQGLTAEKTLAKIRERVAEHDATIAANQQGREKLSSTTQAPLKKGFNNLLKYPAKFPISVEARAAVREYQKWARNLNTAYAKKDPALIELAEEELARRRENLNNFLEPTAFRSFMSKFGAFLPDELVFFMSYWPKLAILGFISAMAITGAGWMVGGAVLAPIAALVAFRKEIHNGLVTFLYSLGKGNKDSRWTKIAEALENARFSTLVIGGLSISIVAYGAALMGPVGLIALPFVFATGLALRSLTDMIYEFIMTGESQTFNKITSFIGKHPIAFGASLFASMGVLAGTYSFLGAGFQAIVPALYAGLSSTAMAAITQVNSFIVGTLSSVIPSSGVASVLASPFTMFTGFITGLAGSVGGVIPALAITGIMAVGINLLLDKIADTAGLKGTGRTIFKFFGAVGTIVIAAGLMAAGGFLAIGIGLGLLAAIGFAIKIIDSRASHKAAKLLTQTANKTTFTNEEALGLIKRFAEGPTAQVTATAENEQSQKAKMSETKEAIATKAETANNATQFVNALEAKGVDLTAFYIQSHNILKDPNSSPESRIMAAEVIRVITERHPATDTYMNWEDSRIAELELGPVSLLAHDRDGQKISRAKQVVSALKEKHLALGDRLVELGALAKVPEEVKQQGDSTSKPDDSIFEPIVRESKAGVGGLDPADDPAAEDKQNLANAFMNLQKARQSLEQFLATSSPASRTALNGIANMMRVIEKSETAIRAAADALEGKDSETQNVQKLVEAANKANDAAAKKPYDKTLVTKATEAAATAKKAVDELQAKLPAADSDEHPLNIAKKAVSDINSWELNLDALRKGSQLQKRPPNAVVKADPEITEANRLLQAAEAAETEERKAPSPQTRKDAGDAKKKAEAAIKALRAKFSVRDPLNDDTGLRTLRHELEKIQQIHQDYVIVGRHARGIELNHAIQSLRESIDDIIPTQNSVVEALLARAEEAEKAAKALEADLPEKQKAQQELLAQQEAQVMQEIEEKATQVENNLQKKIAQIGIQADELQDRMRKIPQNKANANLIEPLMSKIRALDPSNQNGAEVKSANDALLALIQAPNDRNKLEKIAKAEETMKAWEDALAEQQRAIESIERSTKASLEAELAQINGQIAALAGQRPGAAEQKAPEAQNLNALQQQIAQGNAKLKQAQSEELKKLEAELKGIQAGASQVRQLTKEIDELKALEDLFHEQTQGAAAGPKPSAASYQQSLAQQEQQVKSALERVNGQSSQLATITLIVKTLTDSHRALQQSVQQATAQQKEALERAFAEKQGKIEGLKANTATLKGAQSPQAIPNNEDFSKVNVQTIQQKSRQQSQELKEAEAEFKEAITGSLGKLEASIKELRSLEDVHDGQVLGNTVGLADEHRSSAGLQKRLDALKGQVRDPLDAERLFNEHQGLKQELLTVKDGQIRALNQPFDTQEEKINKLLQDTAKLSDQPAPAAAAQGVQASLAGKENSEEIRKGFVQQNQRLGEAKTAFDQAVTQKLQKLQRDVETLEAKIPPQAQNPSYEELKKERTGIMQALNSLRNPPGPLSGQGFWSGQVDTITKKLDQIGNSLDKLETEEKMQALAAEIAELVHKLDDQKQPKPLLLNDIRGQISGLKQAVNGLPDQAVAGVAVAKAALEKLNHDLLARERTDKEKVDKLLEQVAAMKEAPETRNSNDPIAVLHTQIAKAKSDIAQLEQKINEAKASVKFTEHKQALEASLTDLNGIKQAWESLERKLPEIIKLHKRIDNATTKNLPNQAAAKQLPLYEELSSEVKQLQGELTQVQEVASTEARRLLESDQAHLDQFNQADQKMLSDIHKEIAVMEDNPSGASQDGIKKLQAQIQKGIATANFGETQQKLAKELTSRLDRVQTTLSQNLVALQNLNPEIVALEQFVNHYEKPGPKDRKDDEALPQYQEQLQKVAGLQAQLRELSLHPEEQENKAALQRLNDIERRLSVLKQNENEDAELQSMNDAFSKQVDAMIEAQRIPDPNDLNTLQQNMRKAVVFQETYNLLHPAHTLENAKQKWVELDEKISQPLLQLQTEISAIKDAKQGLLPLPSYVALAEKLNSLQAEFSQINGENLGAVKAAQKMLNSLYEQLTMLVEQEQELVRLYSERIRFMETPGKIFTQENIQNLRLRITAAKDQAKFKEIKEALENGLARLDQVEATLNNSAQKLGELNNAILALENSLRQWEAQPQNRPGNFELAEEKIFQEVERLKTELKQLPVHKAATLDRLLTVQQGLESLKFRDHQKLSTLSQELGKMGELTNLADIQALKQDIRAAQANAVFKEVHEELEKLLANVTRLETDWQNIPRKLNKISTRIHELHIEMDIRAHTPANQEVKLPSYENLKQELRKLGGDLNQLRVAKKMHLLLAQEDARLQQFHEEDGAIVLEMSHKLRAIEANPNCTQADINILREDISKAKAIVKFSEAHKELQKQSTHLESVQANLDQHISRLLSVAQDLTEEVNALGDKEERKEEAIKEPSDFPSYRQLKDRISALKTELLRLSPEHAKVQQAVVELETIQRTLQSLLEQDQGVKTPLWQTFQSWLSSSEEDQKATTESLQSSIRMQQQKVIFRETFEYLNNLMSIETQVPPTHAHHATSYTNMAGTIGGPNQQQLPGFAQAAGEAAAAINQHEASENEDISAHIADAGGLFGDDDASKVAEAAFKPS